MNNIVEFLNSIGLKVLLIIFYNITPYKFIVNPLVLINYLFYINNLHTDLYGRSST